ncbi:hypothetical protein, partial [Paenarthrobacter aromaticivorans]|uniref:hypothetical protein n=1 Tax=Paenarthrobacter aromaticivorans TaxID=2849150 RepID=UPI003A7F95BD
TRPPHTGVRNGPAKISTNQKTIGINKLGTLLSSQTTDPPKHHPAQRTTKAAHPTRPLEKKSYFLAAYRTVHTFRLSVSHPATQKTIHAPHPQRKSTPTTTQQPPKTPASPPSNITPFFHQPG